MAGTKYKPVILVTIRRVNQLRYIAVYAVSYISFLCGAFIAKAAISNWLACKVLADGFHELPALGFWYLAVVYLVAVLASYARSVVGRQIFAVAYRCLKITDVFNP